MTTWGLLGHDRAVQAFQGAQRAGRLGHAYLITGVPGVGRRTFAARMAQALRCAQPKRPCRTCRLCRAVEPDAPFWHAAVRRDHPDEVPDPRPPRDRRDAGYIHTAYLDLHVLRRRDGFRDVPIRGVRELAAESYLKPAHGLARVAIIDAAEELSTPAANALLKTLEEPAPHAVIILIAQQASAVLPTLRSRCHHIALAPVPAALISGHLVQKLGIEPEASEAIAAAAQGRVGWAIGAARDQSRWRDFAERQEKADAFERAPPAARFMAVDELLGRGRPLQQAEQAYLWLGHISRAQAAELRTAMRATGKDAPAEARAALGAVVARMLRAREAQVHIQHNVTPKLVFEDLALRPAAGPAP